MECILSHLICRFLKAFEKDNPGMKNHIDKSKYLVVENYVRFIKKQLLSRILFPFERMLLRSINKSEKVSPIFIVGVPRSGTTLAYQLLTSHVRVGYITNSLEKNFYWPLIYSSIVFRSKKNLIYESSYNSTYGVNKKDGRNAPNQGVEIWARLFGTERHFLPVHEVSNLTKNSVFKHVLALSKIYGRDFLFKELSLGAKLNVIKKIFPDARFIYIKRNFTDTACSIFSAMEANGVPEGVMWGMQFEGYEKYLSLPRVEMIYHQVNQIEKSIKEQLEGVDHKDLYFANYNEICSDPRSFVYDIASKFNLQLIDKDGIPKSFKSSITHKDGPLRKQFRDLFELEKVDTEKN